ncbi:helix-turn-helix transcriptional regulator [Actinocorallia aurantiaca]|uniref:HTH luxR-type domain-containing protein n=1 Tax=Actinocorallia aurantiaca TaxID=46204 RepID=A0ABP6GMT8_9ACTN
MRYAPPITPATVKSLVRTGHPEEAALALAELESGPDPRGTVRSLRDWASCWYPGLLGPSRDACASPPPICEGLDALRELMSTGAGDEAVARAERVLGDCPMGSGALEPLLASLATLVYADRADRAARWCEPLLEQTTAHCDPVWLGAFAAIRAESAFRQGDLPAAVEAVRTALTHISWQSWGVAIGIPFAIMISAKAVMGKNEDALRYLAVPVPPTMFETPAGLHYLAARGYFRLAAGDAESAFAEFLECGERMRRWEVDLPGLAAWRIGAGRAALELGRRREALALAEEQLDRLDRLGAGRTRTRGLALRLQAEAGTPRRRGALLEEAAAVLEEAGDRLELAGTLSALGKARDAGGDRARALAAGARARAIAASCGLPSDPGQGEEVPAGAHGVSRASVVLSEAELKVATLAAQGLSNRQISSRLYVTVSTVEQHLTRIYRKLGVSRRLDLAEFL